MTTARRILAALLGLLALYGLFAFGDLLGTAVLAAGAALLWPRRRREQP